MSTRPLSPGRVRAPVDATSQPSPTANANVPYELPAHHLVTHGVVVGMTGSGKTGLCIDLIEEAARSRVPALLIDIKGDLPNLALLFDELDAPSFQPWVDADAARRHGKRVEDVAAELAGKWREGLASWGLGPADVRALRESIALRVITPGTSSGEPLHVLSPLEVRSDLWEIDEEAARDALSAAISLLLRMIERDADPATGREHVLLSHLAERRLRAGEGAGLEALLSDLQAPPIERVGALSVDEFLPPKERASLATDLNALVASPTFSSWRKGAPLDVGAWLTRASHASPSGDDDKTPITIVSVAHLEDEERMLVLGLVLDQTLAWVRGLSGTTDLRALVLFDEVFGFLPPHPANPPTKRPLLSLLKQARAFGVGCVLATQNPIDLDYKALSNAGVWFVGRLQTDADRERVVEGLIGAQANAGEVLNASELAAIIKALPPRTFFVRDVHAGQRSTLLETRWTLSWLRGPMTRREIKRLQTEGRIEAPREVVAATAPSTAASVPAKASAPITQAPPPPEGWRALWPHPPAAPVDAWSYHPSAAVVARAEIADARLGVRFAREVAVMVPMQSGTLDLDRAATFDHDPLERNAPVAGARFVPFANGPIPARALRSLEKALKDQAMRALRTTVMVNDPLELVSQPGETPQQFAERCAQNARALAHKVRGELLAKHDPKIQRLAAERDASHRAAASVITARDRQKAQKELAAAQAALDEAVERRDAELVARETELLQAPAETKAKELGPKKDALVVESFAIVWLAG